MLRVIAVIGVGLAKVAAECPSGDAICQDQEMPSDSLLQREKRALGKELAEDSRVMAETEAQARVRLAKELNSENFTISLGDCNPMSGTKDTSCCWAKGVSCTNPPFTPEAACPLGALCTAPMNINPFAAPSYGYCQCQGGSSCQAGPLGDGCAVAFPNPFGERNETKETADLAEETARFVTAKAKDSRVMAETEAQARVRLAKELNSENFTISLGDCNPMSGTKDTSCCWAKGVSCTNPPFTPEAACPLGALCTAPMNINPFAAPSYGYCQCQGGSSCQAGPLGDGCAVAFPNPFGEKNETKETADLAEETAQVTAKAKEVPSEQKDVLVQEKVNDTKAGCYPGTKDMSCCLSRGMTCTNPPQLSSAQSTSCPVGAVCSAPFNLNPFAAPQYGYCQCQLGALCSSDGNSCGGAGSALDPFLKCSGSAQDPPNCCPRRLTCTNPPMLDNITSTTCDLGQACDAEPTFGGMAPVFGTCKCMVGTCGATGQCGR